MSYSDVLRQLAHRRRIALPGEQHPEPLADLDYDLELRLKNDALGELWRSEQLPGQPEAALPAPVPRGYRTSTKRRAQVLRGVLRLGFPGTTAFDGPLAGSLLDAPSHLQVYRALAAELGRPVFAALVTALNWLIVRGEGEALSVIANLRAFDAKIIRAAKRLGEALQDKKTARALLLYLDPSGSEYYLEARRPTKGLAFKRVFGPETLGVTIDGRRLKHPAVSFSQVNGPMLPVLTATARQLLAPTAGQALLDLYCGYGLFSFTVGAGVRRVTSVDVDGPAIEAARANARSLGRASSMRFVAGSIDAELVEERLREDEGRELVLLDPPRGGTAPGVVTALATRQPERVLHLCCGIDEMPRELAAWTRAGMRLERAVPLDLFAGTASLEVMLLFARRGTLVNGQHH